MMTLEEMVGDEWVKCVLEWLGGWRFMWLVEFVKCVSEWFCGNWLSWLVEWVKACKFLEWREGSASSCWCCGTSGWCVKWLLSRGEE